MGSTFQIQVLSTDPLFTRVLFRVSGDKESFQKLLSGLLDEIKAKTSKVDIGVGPGPEGFELWANFVRHWDHEYADWESFWVREGSEIVRVLQEAGFTQES